MGSDQVVDVVLHNLAADSLDRLVERSERE